MEVIVERDRCEANGVCEGLVPEVFQLDDDDVLHLREPRPPAELLDKVRHAVRSCPKTALKLRE